MWRSKLKRYYWCEVRGMDAPSYLFLTVFDTISEYHRQRWSPECVLNRVWALLNSDNEVGRKSLEEIIHMKYELRVSRQSVIRYLIEKSKRNAAESRDVH